MAANIGRNMKILKSSVELLGIRTKSFSINGTPIDITTDDDLGYRTLLAEAGEKSIDISFDGITKDAVLRAIINGGTTAHMLTDVTLEYANGDTITGCDWFLTNLDESGTYNDAVTFSGSMQSSGAWTYTPAP